MTDKYWWQIVTPYDDLFAEMPKYHDPCTLFENIAEFMRDSNCNQQIEAAVVFHENDDDEEGTIVIDLDKLMPKRL